MTRRRKKTQEIAKLSVLHANTKKKEKKKTRMAIGAFYTQRPGNYSICLSEQKILAIIFIMKTNQVLRPFSTTTEKTIC